MAGEPLLDLVLLVCGIVVENYVDRLILGHFALDPIEEADELLIAVTLHVLPDDGSVEYVECSEQRGRAVALVVVGQRAGAPLLHRQTWLGTIESLYLRLLVDRQDHRMGRRIEIKTDDIGEFFGECRIVRQLEAAPAMRSKAMRLPDRLHCRNGKPDRLGHRARSPVGRLMRGRFLRQPDNLSHAWAIPAPCRADGTCRGAGHRRLRA